MKETSLLFRPIQIGNLEIRNRIVMAPVATNFPSPEGYVTRRHIDYYAERAKGGAGLILVEGAYFEPKGKRLVNQLFAGGGAHEREMKRLVDEVHSHGARIGLQLTHGGRECSSRVTGFPPQGPSNLPSVYRGITKEIEVPEALTEEEISEVIDSFVQAVEAARRAGFDLVEIHGAHGYLISQFLSPAVNFRKDRYGKDVTGRARIVTELLDRIKARLGGGFPVIVRFNADDFIEGGMTLSEGKVLGRLFEEHGADCLHVSGGFHASVPFYMIPPMGLPRNCLIHLAEGVKGEVSIPVIGVGRIIDPREAEEILRKGKADLIALGRALIADPEFPRKAQEGREDEIRTCIGCNQGCIGTIHKQLPMTCLVNPAAGREREFKISKAESSKKVVVIGGGPAGLEAARVLSLRGHRVTLFEKEERVGGKLRLAMVPPTRETIGKVMSYYETVLPRMGVDLRLGREAGERDVSEERPDEVIVATGAEPSLPEIPGIDLPLVVLAEDVLSGKAMVGEKVVIVGGGMVGVETAEFLLEKGKEVTLVEMREDVALEMEARTRSYLLYRLKQYPVEVLLQEKVVEITRDGVICAHGPWRKQILGADHVVLATGARPNRRLAEQISEKGWKMHSIGDCAKARDALEAIYEGACLGRKI